MLGAVSLPLLVKLSTWKVLYKVKLEDIPLYTIDGCVYCDGLTFICMASHTFPYERMVVVHVSIRSPLL
jgi:hypothetical protein